MPNKSDTDGFIKEAEVYQLKLKNQIQKIKDKISFEKRKRDESIADYLKNNKENFVKDNDKSTFVQKNTLYNERLEYFRKKLLKYESELQSNNNYISQHFGFSETKVDDIDIETQKGNSIKDKEQNDGLNMLIDSNLKNMDQNSQHIVNSNIDKTNNENIYLINYSTNSSSSSYKPDLKSSRDLSEISKENIPLPPLTTTPTLSTTCSSPTPPNIFLEHLFMEDCDKALLPQSEKDKRKFLSLNRDINPSIYFTSEKIKDNTNQEHFNISTEDKKFIKSFQTFHHPFKIFGSADHLNANAIHLKNIDLKGNSNDGFLKNTQSKIESKTSTANTYFRNTSNGIPAIPYKDTQHQSFKTRSKFYCSMEDELVEGMKDDAYKCLPQIDHYTHLSQSSTSSATSVNSKLYPNSESTPEKLKINDNQITTHSTLNELGIMEQANKSPNGFNNFINVLNLQFDRLIQQQNQDRRNIESLRIKNQQDYVSFNEAINELRNKNEQINETIAENTELQQTENENIKLEIKALEEKLSYQIDDRTQDMIEMMENIQTRIAKIEVAQQTLQLVSSIDGLEMSAPRNLLLKFINILIALLQLILLLTSTIAHILGPFIKTRFRTLISLFVGAMIGVFFKIYPNINKQLIFLILPFSPSHSIRNASTSSISTYDK